MKTLTLTFIMASFALRSFSQSPDKVLAQVSYTFTHVKDTTDRQNPFTEDMILVLGKNSSIYSSYDKILRDREMRKSLQEQLKNQVGGNTNVSLSNKSSKRITSTEYYYFHAQKKYFRKERLINNYFIETPIDQINWKIMPDTMSFSGIACQKAIATFKGRNWIAWFAADLPFQAGPWKLNGLPGLIIDASDDRQDVHFAFKGIEKISSAVPEKNVEDTPVNGLMVKTIGMEKDVTTTQEIKLPDDAIKTSTKDFDRLNSAYQKDPQGFMQTQLAGTGIVMKVTQGISGSGNSSAIKKSVENNPLELQDK
ncbi:GLPGLI family protein [Pedobacter sp. AW1-32]|uniref:GLPGLI family protein n=1 Tax=Pedobacter sp. AW1-32 TaxID=3383026 RepID=UPI003FEFCC2A